MKSFTVEGEHWSKDVEIDDTLFENERDMPFEAMTQAVEAFFEGEYEEEFTGEPALALFMVAYEKGRGHIERERAMALTEFILINAGHYVLAEQFKRYAADQLQEQLKKKKEDGESF